MKNSLLSVSALAACALFATVAQAAGPKLSLLSTLDDKAIAMYKCEASLDKIAKFVGEDGWDIGTDYRDTYKKAGDALVIRAALLLPQEGGSSGARKVNFLSKSTERKIEADIKAHRDLARSSVGNDTFDSGFAGLADCARNGNINEARELVDWLDNDVALFERLK